MGKPKKTKPTGDISGSGSVYGTEFMRMDGSVNKKTLTGWEMRDEWNGNNNFPRWKTFSDQISYRPYTIKDVQSRIDDAEPENMYNNASGCGSPPIITWGAEGKKRLEAYRACTAGATASSSNLDNALADALRAKAQAGQSGGGLSTGAMVAIFASLAVVGIGAYFVLRK